MLLPVARLGKPRKRARKRRIVPASRQPPGVVNHTQTAQRFDQTQLAVIEVGKLRLALQ
jgi:hypothetical protein